MERETKKISTPNGIEIEIVTYATGREVRAIEQKYYTKAKLDIVAGQPKISDMDLSAQFDVEQEMVRLLVKTVGGSTENILDTVLDMRSEDYEFVIASLNEVTKKK